MDCIKYHVTRFLPHTFTAFLVAYTRLYKSLCWLVHRSVGPSVTQCEIKPKSDLTSFNAPAHPYESDAVVYTTLFEQHGSEYSEA